MLIERDCSLKLMLERHLRHLGRFEVEIAEEADVGVERALHGQFDIIIASLHLPDTSPTRLLEALAAVRPQPVLIALGWRTQLEALGEERVAALWGALPMPLTRAELTDTIYQALRHHQERHCRGIVPTRQRGGEVLGRRAAPGPPVRLGHYELNERLGGGEKGMVYRGVDRRSGDAVAIRAVPQVMVERLGAGPRWFERFTREASSASSVNHSHLSALLDHGFEERHGCLFVVSELAEGATLRESIEAEPLEPAAALKMGVQIASALSAIHTGGFAHRLVRPTNIVIDDLGEATLTDLGVAGMLAWDLMPLRDRLDRTPYLSPEQLRLGRIDDRSDQFALGLVLHEALTGAYCFDGDSPGAKVHQVMNERPKLALDPALEEREQVEELLERMLATNPEERFQGDAEVIAALERGAEDVGATF